MSERARGSLEATSGPVESAREMTDFGKDRAIGVLGELIVARVKDEKNRWARPAARLGLRCLRHLGDPAISYEIGGARLSIPLSHDLPLHKASHPHYSSNLSRVVAHVAAHSPDFKVID